MRNLFMKSKSRLCGEQARKKSAYGDVKDIAYTCSNYIERESESVYVIVYCNKEK